MKKLTLFLAILMLQLNVNAQIPAYYYDSANGLTGYTLKTELSNIITNGYINRGYDNLYIGYITTDSDNYYENDGSVLDMYSENPNGSDPYNYIHNNNKCGNYSNEGDCYNREHLFPQSWFGSASPMVSDIHHVVPSDGKVNGYRSSYPLADVGTLSSPPSSITNPTSNGSKLGICSDAGFSGIVFEPIDEFKGDIARIYFYFATRYEDNIGSWQNNGHAADILNGSSDQVFQDWYLAVLLQWHHQDPVSQREIDRNNAAYDYQGNANPFISHPEWVDVIWNPVPDTVAPTTPTNLTASNPTGNTINLTWTASTDNVGVTSYDIYKDNVLSFNTPNTNYIANGLNENTEYCFTVKAKDSSGNTSDFSNQDCETTITGNSNGAICSLETFDLISSNSSSYSNRTWTGDNGLVWNATNARTDQTINNKSITLRNGVLTSPSSSGGIGNLTVTSQRKFTGGTGTYDVLVNGSIVGTIPYGDNVETTTISNINIENNVIVSFSLTTGDDTSPRVALDDLSWTCFSTASVNNNQLSNSISIYPNPTNNELHIKSITNIDAIVIYNYLGKKVFSKKNTSTINISSLNNGIYILKIEDTKGNIAFKKVIKK